jgi:hypothetical protein
MMISALGYGNETALVNDPAREDVMDPVMVRAAACSPACIMHARLPA